MHLRILLITLLTLFTAACAPYQGGGYYRTEVYQAEPTVYPGYYRSDRYYVVPQQRYYYSPAPRYQPVPPGYYRPAPGPRHYRPGPPPQMAPGHGGGRGDYGHRDRNDYGRDRERQDHRHPPGPPGPGGWPGR